MQKTPKYLWLHVLPISQHHFDLSAQELCDTLAICYQKPLLNTPAPCDSCGSSSDLSHALSCHKGLIVQCHNEIRDTFGVPCVGIGVSRASCQRQSADSLALIADLAIRGAWMHQIEALFDIRVVNTDAQSYLNKSTLEVLALEKKLKYQAACEERRAIFTPCVFRWMVS